MRIAPALLLVLLIGVLLGRWSVHERPQTLPPSAAPLTPPAKPTAALPAAPVRDDAPSPVADLPVATVLSELRGLDLSHDPASATWQRHLLVQRYAQLDPETALTYVATLDSAAHEMELANALSVWAKADPRAAAEHVSQADFSDTHGLGALDTALSTVSSQWAARDANAALEWAKQLPEDQRAAAVQPALARIAATTPPQAIAAASALPTEDHEQAFATIAQQWALNQPESTASWFSTVRDPEQQAGAAYGLMTSWMHKDPAAASKWVSGLANGTPRDRAIAAMVEAPTLRNDPEAAVRWAASITNRDERAELLTKAVKRWELIDPAAAAAWAAANSASLQP